MGLVSLVIGFAPAVGPTLSGVLVDSIGWRMLFVVITVVGVLLVLSAVKFLENYGDFERTSFDKLSVLLSTVGLVCLLYGLSTFSSTTNPAMTAGFIVVGLVVIAIFVRRQLKLENPLLKVTVLKTRNYRIAIIVAIINFGVLIGLGTILPLYLQTLRGFSALETGLTLLPLSLIHIYRLKDEYGAENVAVHIVDTKLPATPLNMLVWEAVRQREKGMPLEQMIAWATEAHNYMHIHFMVDDLKAVSYTHLQQLSYVALRITRMQSSSPRFLRILAKRWWV